MSNEFEQDLQRVVEGSLTRDEAAEVHGAANVGEVLSLHDRLSELSSVEVDVAPWYLVAPRLASNPTRRRGRRATIVSVVAGLILIPAAAEGIEAVAPDAVRGTLIDSITDILPWDNDPPATDQAPEPPETEVPTERDQREESGVSPPGDGQRETDAPNGDAEPNSDSVDPDRSQDPVRSDSAPTTEASPRDHETDRDGGRETDRLPDRPDRTDERDRRDGQPDAVETDLPTASTVATDRPIESGQPIEPTSPAESADTTLPPDDARADRSGSDATTPTTASDRDSEEQPGDERG